jgi:hypothetical protein
VALAVVLALRVGVLLALAHLKARIISRVPSVAEKPLHDQHVLPLAVKPPVAPVDAEPRRPSPRPALR